jgi:epoxyqueuosine reductase
MLPVLRLVTGLFGLRCAWSAEQVRVEKKRLTTLVKETALRLGFDLVGVTTPDPPATFPVFLKWIAAGRFGEMNYLAQDRSLQRRADPRQILPECASILVLGIRYAAPTESDPGTPEQPRGRVAAYAWSADYHDILDSRLAALQISLEALVGEPVPARWYTDTGPILERDLAQRAGLGWMGKNTCLIRPGLGSYFFLAELLLGLNLEPDTPFVSDHCGSCTRCIDACPTQCILPDRTLDAQRCISYLTIELKGSIPLELRPLMGNWVFGCDLCQEVCPWNIRFAAPQANPVLMPGKVNPVPDLLTDLMLSPEAFNQRFGGTPIKRSKRRGYLRNVAIALGNVQDRASQRAALPALGFALYNDPEPLVRGSAAWAIGQYDLPNQCRS